MSVSDASFRAGQLTATGLPSASVEAVLCTDAIQFPDEPAGAYDEIRRVLKPGGRVVLTCWEPRDRDDERLSARIRRANLQAGLAPGRLHQRRSTGPPVVAGARARTVG